MSDEQLFLKNQTAPYYAVNWVANVSMDICNRQKDGKMLTLLSLMLKFKKIPLFGNKL